MSRLLFLLLSGLAGLSACRREPSTIPLKPVGPNRVLVLNEGNFMWNNASLDMYDPASRELQSDVYKTVNGRSLGDVLQSGRIINGTLWLVVNNSGKICGLDTATFREKWVIRNLGSPRHVAQAAGRVWITDIYASRIRVLNESDRSEAGYIATSKWTEQLLNDGTGMAVACYDGWLRRFDTLSLRMIDSFRIGHGLRWLTMDRNRNIWALSSGDDSMPRLGRLNPRTGELKTWDLKGLNSAGSLCISADGDSLYFLSAGVFAMGINDVDPPSQAIYKVGGANFYGLGCDPESGLIYVADAADYVSRGTVHVINGKGELKEKFKTGLIPSGFIFY